MERERDLHYVTLHTYIHKYIDIKKKKKKKEIVRKEMKISSYVLKYIECMHLLG